jgi:rhodanese-related sulfurtransferase
MERQIRSRRHLLTAALSTLTLVALGAVPAPAQQATLSPPEARAAIAAGKLTLVDVRSPDEWRETGVPAGARRLDYRNRADDAAFVAAFAALVGGDHSAPVAVICRSGRRSAQVRALLLANGFRAVADVNEGVLGGEAGPGWLRRGLPLTPCPDC